jgi:hypothetical protein
MPVIRPFMHPADHLETELEETSCNVSVNHCPGRERKSDVFPEFTQQTYSYIIYQYAYVYVLIHVALNSFVSSLRKNWWKLLPIPSITVTYATNKIKFHALRKLHLYKKYYCLTVIFDPFFTKISGPQWFRQLFNSNARRRIRLTFYKLSKWNTVRLHPTDILPHFLLLHFDNKWISEYPHLDVHFTYA